jgi:OPA family glycerol-3-phosphate transporter-like MFS transporter
MDLVLVGICLAVIIGLYFHNNPMGHSRWFMMSRFINWFPLGDGHRRAQDGGLCVGRD